MSDALARRDINKGDRERVEVRSRSVARETKQKGIDSYFAGTPPLALVRYVTGTAATMSRTGKRRQLVAPDAKRAFLHPDALTATLARHGRMLDAEEVYVRHASCSSRMATLGSESPCRHWLAQFKQPSMFVWTHITRFGHGRAWCAGCGDDLDWLSQKLNENLELVQKSQIGSWLRQ